MKFIKYLLCLLTFHGLAQTDCDHNVSTNPDAPTNNALPVNLAGAPITSYKNGFDWYPIDPISGELMDYACTNMFFAGISINEKENIRASLMPYYDYLKTGPLPIGINGWELLMVNLGRYPNDTDPIINSDLPSWPYIVIYNRYSGVLRVFTNFGLDRTINTFADAMQIDLTFKSNVKTGLLRLAEGQDQTLDLTTNVNILSSVVKAPQIGKAWASTDFQIAYDPCTCFYPSQLYLLFTEIKHTDITLHSRSVTLDNEPLVNNTNLTVNPTEFLTNFDYTGNTTTGNGGGMVMYQTMSNMIDDYYEKYKEYNQILVSQGEHNAKVKKNLSVLRMAKFVVGFIASPPVATLQLTIAQRNVFMKNKAQEKAEEERLGNTTEEIDAYYEGIGDGINWFEVVKGLQTDVVNSIAQGEEIINTEELFRIATQIFGEKASTFIAKNFTEENAPEAPPVPTASFTETHYTGLTTVKGSTQGPNFYTPGTYGSSVTGSPIIEAFYEYPVYNEVLGTFALLKSPKIKISESIPSDFQNILAQKTIVYNTGNIGINMQRYQSWTKEYQFELAEDLKFAMNSVLDVKGYTINASFNIVAKPKLLSSPNNVIQNSYLDPVSNVNVTSNNADLTTNTPVISHGTPYQQNLNTPDFDYNHYGYGSTPIPGLTTTKSTIEVQTPYIPIDAFQPMVAGLGIRSEAVSYKEHLFPSQNLSNYTYTTGINGYTFDLTDPDVIKPPSVNMNTAGFEYDFVVELKLQVDIEFHTLNSAGVTNKVTQLLTYQIIPENITWLSSDIVPEIVTSSDNFGQYQQNLILGNTNFNGQQVNGCKLVGNTYTCQAWNNVTIDGNITTSGGYKANIYGGVELVVLPESVVSPEIILATNILDYSHPMPKVDSNYVTSFCNGINGQASPYKANQASAKVIAIMDSLQALAAEQEIINASWDFELFPNPATHNSTLRINSRSDFEVGIHVVDLTGKTVQVKVTANGEKSHSLDLSNCQKGIYFVTVSTYGGSQTKQLIVQ